jgi:hypothetical protein
MTHDPRWVLVTGAGLNVTAEEQAAATLLGGLLAREGYNLIAGTWAGVDELVTRAFLRIVPDAEHATRIVHVVNHDFRGHHAIRVGREIRSRGEPYSQEAIDLADAGVIVSGRQGSKPAMDALLRIGKPVIPLAWLGHDAFGSLQDLLAGLGGERRNRKRLLLSLIDPASARDETLSRVLGAVLRPQRGVFISYHRADTGADAGRLAFQLAASYGNRRVFIDYESLPAAEYIESILDKAAACRMLIVLIGPNFIERVRNERDYVRREILAAQNGGAAILPIAIDTSFSSLRDTLPDALSFLTERNGIVLDRAKWDVCMQQIEEAADSALGVTPMRATWVD